MTTWKWRASPQHPPPSCSIAVFGGQSKAGDASPKRRLDWNAWLQRSKPPMLNQRYAEANPGPYACQAKLKKSSPMQPNDAFRRTTSKPCINIHTHAKGFRSGPNSFVPQSFIRGSHGCSKQIWPICQPPCKSGFTLGFIFPLQPNGKSAKKKKKIPRIPVKQWGNEKEEREDAHPRKPPQIAGF